MQLLLCLAWCWAAAGAGTGARAGAAGRLLGAVDQVVSGVADDLTQGPAWPEDYAPKLTDGDEFEYIVVGAGAGGAAVAARLALAGRDVLLLEAGGDPTLLTRIPGAAMGLLGSDVDWAYPTVPNYVSCLSSTGQQCRFSRGRCLGGSSSINYMMFVRGGRADHDTWGVPGWGARDMQPYYLKYEGLQEAALARLPPASRPFHNTTGIMQVDFFPETKNTWHERIFEGLQSLNFPFNPDVNAESQVGVSRVAGYVLGGERMSTARGYLADEEVKKELKVAKHTLAGALVIDGDNVVRGINVISGALAPRQLRLYASKEVILSAGAVGTPQILQLSGIGPAEHLEALGVPVRADLPVGEGLIDHVLPLLLVQADPGPGLLAPNPFVFAAKGAQGAQWLASRTGELATNGVTDVTAFLNTSCYDIERRRLLPGPGCELPTTQLIHAYIDRGLLPGIEPVVKNAIGFNDDVVQQLSDANVEHALLVVSPVLLQPRSTGRVRLASADPRDRPLIYPNYLSDERDVEEMLRAIAVVEQLTETAAWAARGARLLRLRLPGCPDPAGEGGAGYWRCYARHMTYSVYHAVGSVALGGPLDERGRVRGVRGARVADASLAPRLPRGNTEAMVLAIAEKIADLVLEDDANETV
ncbi:unnamed protein product [Plutella xylostella]|uniref:(diamondback moth) hypothetical protein n=1 Tax=Plutella xylostella TaxID=51655 RepID=A0A8S4GDL6_PLUXY|nr:unnamed protein product [Plutella xylostella]